MVEKVFNKQDSRNDLAAKDDRAIWMCPNRLKARLRYNGRLVSVALPTRFVGEGHDMQEVILTVLMARKLKLTVDDFEMYLCRLDIDIMFVQGDL